MSRPDAAVRGYLLAKSLIDPAMSRQLKQDLLQIAASQLYERPLPSSGKRFWWQDMRLQQIYWNDWRRRTTERARRWERMNHD